MEHSDISREADDDSSKVSDVTQRGSWREVGHLMEHNDVSSEENDATECGD